LKNISRFVLALALGAFGVWLWMALFPSGKSYFQQLEKLAQAVSVRAGKLPARMIGAQTVAGFFSTNVEIKIDLPNRGSRPR